MQHLNEEDLARLVDEEPVAEEAAHLAHCALCALELEELRTQTQALAALPDLIPPPEVHTRLRAAMALEGLFLSSRARRLSAVRIAASVALFAAGGLAGFLGRGAAEPSASLTLDRSPPASVEEAAVRLQAAEAAYTAALADYSATAGTPPAGDPLNRLAALEGIVLTTRAALNDAPADPVINGYHLTALEQRDAIMRQLESSPAQTQDNEQEWY